jgi:hypothetical protein
MCDNDVATDGGICNLTNALPVREANNEAVFFGVVFVFVLADHLAASPEIGFSLTAAALLYLKAFEVSFVFQHLDKRHCWTPEGVTAAWEVCNEPSWLQA